MGVTRGSRTKEVICEYETKSNIKLISRLRIVEGYVPEINATESITSKDNSTINYEEYSQFSEFGMTDVNVNCLPDLIKPFGRKRTCIKSVLSSCPNFYKDSCVPLVFSQLFPQKCRLRMRKRIILKTTTPLTRSYSPRNSLKIF